MRFIIAISVALSLSGAVFLLMAFLIKPPSSMAIKTSKLAYIEFIDRTETEIKEEEPEPEEELEPEQEPPPPEPEIVQMQPELSSDVEPLALDLPAIDVLAADFNGMKVATLGKQKLAPEAIKPVAMQLSSEAQVVVHVKPKYPAKANRRNIEGDVTVEFFVNEQGKAVNPTVIFSEPKNIFDRAVIKSVMKMKFKPAMENGVFVERKFTYRVEFRK